MPDPLFLKEICDHITYKPGWSFKPNVDGSSVLITYSVPSSTTPDKMVRLSHRVNVDGIANHWKPVVARIFAGVEYVELHEVKEFFQFNGERVFGPHG